MAVPIGCIGCGCPIYSIPVAAETTDAVAAIICECPLVCPIDPPPPPPPGCICQCPIQTLSAVARPAPCVCNKMCIQPVLA